MPAPGSRLSRLLHLRCRTQPPLPARGRSSSGSLPLTPSIDPPDDSLQTLKERKPQTGAPNGVPRRRGPHPASDLKQGLQSNTAQPSARCSRGAPARRRLSEGGSPRSAQTKINPPLPTSPQPAGPGQNAPATSSHRHEPQPAPVASIDATQSSSAPATPLRLLRAITPYSGS